jgi:hypothetical protein
MPKTRKAKQQKKQDDAFAAFAGAPRGPFFQTIVNLAGRAGL